MFNSRDFKFSTKVLIGIFIPLFLVCFTLGIYLVHRIKNDFKAGVDEKGNTVTKLLAKISVVPIITHDYRSLEEYIQEVMEDGEIVYAVVMGENRNPLTKTSLKPPAIDLRQNTIYSAPVFHDKARVGSVEVGISTRRFREKLSHDFSFFFFMTLSTVVLCYFFAYFLSAATTKPLKEIVARMKEVEKGDFSVRQLVKGRDEFSLLAKGFNDMLEHIEKRNTEISEAGKQLEFEIRERRLVEEQLRQAQKLEAIGTLAGGIAHDFNNILGVIIGNAELALFETGNNPPRQESLQEIMAASRRARDLVRQILAFSRQDKVMQEPLLIGAIVKETLKMLRASLPSTITIRQNFNGVDGKILADPTQIHQIMMNLCANAAYAMREQGGLLEVGLDKVLIEPGADPKFHEMKAGRYIKLSVRDTGCGIPQETVARIFDPFFTTKKTGEGTGMGLSVVHGIVKSHRGVVFVESKPGHGTLFDIYFPELESGPEGGARPAAAPGLPTGSERVMFVDDEPPVVEMAKKILPRLGYRVVALTSSRDALETFRAHKNAFDLIITDQTMPEFTGMALAEKVLRLRPDLPIILCTGFSELITDEKLRAIGIKKLVMKPLEIRELAVSIREVLGG